jgi:hypothetical protein
VLQKGLKIAIFEKLSILVQNAPKPEILEK